MRTLKCNLREGCGFERTGPPAGEQVKGIAQAEVDARLEAFGRELTPKFEETNRAIQQLQQLVRAPSPAPSAAPLNPAPLPNSRVSVPSPVSQREDKGTILVFFRDGQEQRANQITQALREAGYKTSATNSNLQEIQQWVQKPSQGFVQVGVAGDDKSLVSELRRLLSPLVNADALAIDTGWAFRASKAQVYVF